MKQPVGDIELDPRDSKKVQMGEQVQPFRGILSEKAYAANLWQRRK